MRNLIADLLDEPEPEDDDVFETEPEHTCPRCDAPVALADLCCERCALAFDAEEGLATW